MERLEGFCGESAMFTRYSWIHYCSLTTYKLSQYTKTRKIDLHNPVNSAKQTKTEHGCFPILKIQGQEGLDLAAGYEKTCGELARFTQHHICV
mmetsp:Transcript_912/g.1878  ORF Transcript_912/g.1878 Transcript_912/m.1878 type:complete len:93 (-) Transcript_912:452-730(-)